LWGLLLDGGDHWKAVAGGGGGERRDDGAGGHVVVVVLLLMKVAEEEEDEGGLGLADETRGEMKYSAFGLHVVNKHGKEGDHHSLSQSLIKSSIGYHDIVRRKR